MLSSPLQRHLNILDYSLSSLGRNKGKNIGVFLVFSAVIFLLASFHLLTSSLVERAGQLLTTAPDITLQQMSAGRQEAISLTNIKKLDELFGIKKKVPRVWGYYFDESNGANYTVMGIDFNEMDPEKLLVNALSSGRMPLPEESGKVVISTAVTDNMNLGTRKNFSLFRPDLTMASFEVVGLFGQNANILTGDLLVMHLDDARNLFSIPPDKATDICVYVTNPAEIDTIAAKIADILPDTRVLTRSHILQTYNVIFSWRSGFGSICLLTALAAFVILAWDKASGLSQEEKREVGILKMLGWQTGDVMAMRFWQSCAVSFLAFLSGFSLAYIHVAFYDALLFKPILIGWSVLQPGFSLAPSVAVADVLLVFSFSVLPYLAATVIPAWHSAIVRPDSVI